MLSHGRRLRGPGPAAVAIFLIGALTAACGSAAAPGAVGAPVDQGAGEAARAAGATSAAAGLDEEQTSGSPTSGGAGSPRVAANQDLLIIKTGTMSLQVTGLDTAINAATQQVEALGGYASGSDRSGDGEDARASITFRIPAAKWDVALTGLRGLAEKVLAEQTRTQDVTGQVVDLGARIRNLEATERALQAIMDRATAIKDVLTVQAELTKVRGEIEQMAGEKGHLEEQAAMSTLTIDFALKPNPVKTEVQGFDPGSEAERASASLVSVLQGVATAGIWFAIVWLPILAFFGIVGGVAFVVFRRMRGPVSGEVPPIEPPAEASA